MQRASALALARRKVHLFDIDIPGKMTFKESLTLTPGETPTVVDTAAGRLGIGICYDIRFPELAMLYAKRGVQALVYPGGQGSVAGFGVLQQGLGAAEGLGFCSGVWGSAAQASWHGQQGEYDPWVMHIYDHNLVINI